MITLWPLLLLLAQPASDPSAATPTLTTTTTVKPAPAQPAPAPPAAPAAITTADDLLTALENADRALRTLQADLLHLKRESELIGNRTQEERGKLFYRVEPAPAPEAPAKKNFQVNLTELVVDNARRPDNRSYTFDGQWLVERQPDQKQIFKRELAPAGKPIDPLALGEGQFPIPIGQKKSRILERFDVALLPPDDGFPTPPGADPAKPPPRPDWVADSYQLKLTPKKGTREFRDYTEIRVWYRKADLLPRMARAVNKDDSADEVILSRVELNKDLPPGVFDTSVPEGWNAQISEYRPQGADD